MRNLEKVFEVFYPDAFERYSRIERENLRFVHYTPAESAIRILQSGELWMRNASCMVDFREVTHGIDCLFSAYGYGDGTKLKNALESIFPGFSAQLDRLVERFDQRSFNDTYLACVSEHDASDDLLGRLSMWRGFGQRLGVALVFKGDPFLTLSNAVALYSCPVAYRDRPQFGQSIVQLASSIDAHANFVRNLGREEVERQLFLALRLSVLSAKHPGFREEKEWRIIHSPNSEGADAIQKTVEVIGGIPQSIYKIPFRDLGPNLSDLLDSVIIGPTQYAGAVVEAFESVLTDAGIPNAKRMIFPSDIPLRSG